MLNAKIKRSTSGSFRKYCTATIAFLNVGREHNDLIVVRRHARMPLIAILRCNSRGRGRISWGSSERGRAGPMGERRESLMPVRHAAVWWNRHRHIRWRHTRRGHIRWGHILWGHILRGCNEPEIKVRQHSREDIKVIYDPGRCYENLPFYFFTFYFLRTLDFAPSTLDMLPSTLDFVPSTLDVLLVL